MHNHSQHLVVGIDLAQQSHERAVNFREIVVGNTPFLLDDEEGFQNLVTRGSLIMLRLYKETPIPNHIQQ